MLLYNNTISVRCERLNSMWNYGEKKKISVLQFNLIIQGNITLLCWCNFAFWLVLFSYTFLWMKRMKFYLIFDNVLLGNNFGFGILWSYIQGYIKKNVRTNIGSKKKFSINTKLKFRFFAIKDELNLFLKPIKKSRTNRIAWKVFTMKNSILNFSWWKLIS